MPTVLGLTTDKSPHAPSTNTTTTTTQSKSLTKLSKAQESQIAKPGTSNRSMGASTNGGGNPGGGRLDTISKRNHAAAREIETLLWRALCDSPEAAKEYMADECIMINPLFSGSDEPMGKDTEPSIETILEGAEPWAGYRFHGDPLVVEIDLMAVALVYKMSLFKNSKKGGTREVVATVSSAWRQTAGADWLLCAQHVAYADDE